MAEEAKGIPSRKHYGDLSKLRKDQLLDFIRQRHEAFRAGTHEDTRFGNKELGLYSWAVPKGLPGPGDNPRLALAQPQHSHAYKDFQGDIPRGQYGGGKVSKIESGQVLITKVEPNRIDFTLAHQRFPERYTMVRTGGKSWLVMNRTVTKSDALEGFKKEKYKILSPEEADQVLHGSHAVSAKIDGASALADIQQDRIEVLSIRKQKKTGYPIVHTERVGGLTGLDIPPELVGTQMRGELYGEDIKSGKAIPPQELGGILNSSLSKALRTKSDRGIQLKLALFRILKDKAAIPAGPAARQARVRELIDKIPVQGTFSTPPMETDPAKARQLYEDIVEGGHPLTQEGIVAEPLEGGTPTKIKPPGEHDVYIREIFPAETVKTGDVRAGGFRYSLEPEGPVVGNVGTGFSHETLKDMLANPDQYVGRAAKIRSFGQFDSGAHRAPRFMNVHEDI